MTKMQENYELSQPTLPPDHGLMQVNIFIRMFRRNVLHFKEKQKHKSAEYFT